MCVSLWRSPTMFTLSKRNTSAVRGFFLRALFSDRAECCFVRLSVVAHVHVAVRRAHDRRAKCISICIISVSRQSYSIFYIINNSPRLPSRRTRRGTAAAVWAGCGSVPLTFSYYNKVGSGLFGRSMRGFLLATTEDCRATSCLRPRFS